MPTVEKAQEIVDTEKAAKLEKKILKDAFTLEDFYDQLQQVKKMGPLDQLLGMIPGIGSHIKNVQMDERALIRIEAMIIAPRDLKTGVKVNASGIRMPIST